MCCVFENHGARDHSSVACSPPSFRVCNRGKIQDRNYPPRTYNKNGAFEVQDSLGKSDLSSCNSNKDQAVLLADLPIVVGGSVVGGVSEVLKVVLVGG